MEPAPDLRLLLEDHFSLEQPPRSRVVGGTILVHAALFATLLTAPASNSSPAAAPMAVADLRKATPLVAPPTALTQREPNPGRVSPELNLEGLLPRPQTRSSMPLPPRMAGPRVFSPPKESVKGHAHPSMPEPPQIAAIQPGAAPPGVTGAIPAAPPQIQTEEKPKLAFDRPGGPERSRKGPSSANLALPTTPRAAVEEAIRSAARGAGGGIVVGDAEDSSGAPGSLGQRPAPGQSASQLQLLSDPKGVDFRPYLIRVLAAVRRNWFAVMPESVRMGRRGRVQIQFAISRDGSVPKLVIASPSGADALDRAAVAGISASNPFPPLPVEFQGDQVRLQLTFSYNISR